MAMIRVGRGSSEDHTTNTRCLSGKAGAQPDGTLGGEEKQQSSPLVRCLGPCISAYPPWFCWGTALTFQRAETLLGIAGCGRSWPVVWPGGAPRRAGEGAGCPRGVKPSSWGRRPAEEQHKLQRGLLGLQCPCFPSSFSSGRQHIFIFL